MPQKVTLTSRFRELSEEGLKSYVKLKIQKAKRNKLKSCIKLKIQRAN